MIAKGPLSLIVLAIALCLFVYYAVGEIGSRIRITHWKRTGETLDSRFLIFHLFSRRRNPPHV